MDQARLRMRKTVMHLAWPLIVQFVLMSAMNVVDTVMLGWYSNTALASVGIALPVFFGVLFVLMAIPIGTMAMVARAVGEGDKNKASSYAC
ncbi:MATE family efflux transporter, partial [Planctomycetota bacterium]